METIPRGQDSFRDTQNRVVYNADPCPEPPNILGRVDS